jgi:catechol 2,3-dioxygenase-like lactoylglutathione lyase family enzyme
MDIRFELVAVPVSDIDLAKAFYMEQAGLRCGMELSDVQDFPWGRFLFFDDPDGNGWSVQQIVRPS